MHTSVDLFVIPTRFVAMNTLAAPAGFRGTKGEILVSLKRSQPLTAKELAAIFGMTANAFRRHLKELEVDGFVEYTREVRGVGQPSSRIV